MILRGQSTQTTCEFLQTASLVFCLLLTASGSGQELLRDGDFELDRGDGSPPSSGAWQLAYLGEAGSIVVANVGVIGNGLYLYTGASTNDFWSAPYQDVAAAPGQVFHGNAYISTPVGSTQWVAGSSARVHLAFLDGNSNVITSFESAGLTNLAATWQPFDITTPGAPPETAWVRFMCILEKPRGTTNLSLAVFDNCSLQYASFTGLEAWPRALGIGADLSTALLNMRNVGNTTVSWQITNAPPWLKANPNAGTLAPSGTQVVQLAVDRSQLTGTVCIPDSLAVTWGTGSLLIRLFVEMPSPAVPNQPSIVSVQGRCLVVQDRLADGSLGLAQDYAIKGVAWSPSSRETPDVFSVRRGEFARWYVADTQLLRELNANTVYTFLDFGTNNTALSILDNLYKYGLKVLVTVDENGTANTNTLLQVVTAYRRHPAILGWVVGNEWNINLYHGQFQTNGYIAAALFTEQMARMIKQLDTNHVVVSTHGDIYPPEMADLVNNLCPSVDVWGLNVYRGSSFTTLFDDWASITSKPMMLSEFGTDAYRTLMFLTNALSAAISVDGAVDEAMQATWDRRLWREIAANFSALDPQHVCLGGNVFEWADEWWKAQSAFGGEVGRHDNLGFYTSWNPTSHPDGFANEEWWGLLSVDRQPRLSYSFFQQDFAAVAARIETGPGGEVLLSWQARSNIAYSVYYHDANWTDSTPFRPLAPFTNLTTLMDGPYQVADTNRTSSLARFYRVAAQPSVPPGTRR